MGLLPCRSWFWDTKYWILKRHLGGHFGTYLDKFYSPCHWTCHEPYISGILEYCTFLWIYSNVQGTPQELQGLLFILYKWKKVDPVHHVCIQQKLGNGASREHCDSILHSWKRSEFHSLLIINVKFTISCPVSCLHLEVVMCWVFLILSSPVSCPRAFSSSLISCSIFFSLEQIYFTLWLLIDLVFRKDES